MPGESQTPPSTGKPDPSVITTENMLLAVKNLEKQTKWMHDGDIQVIREKVEALYRETEIREAHRLELKADSEKALNTAREADQKAVAAALEADQKARTQQTIASDLANSKTETTLQAASKQQQETFSVAIAAIVDGLNDAKGEIRDIRAEKRGGRELVAGVYAFAGFIVALLIIGGIVLASRP